MIYTYHCSGNGKRYHGNFRLTREYGRAKDGMESVLSEAAKEYPIEMFRETLYQPEPVSEKKEVLMQLSLDGKLVATYDTAGEAAKALGKKSSKYLEKEIAGDGKAYGFSWKMGYV